MKEVFADTSFYLALLMRRDRRHKVAVGAFESMDAQIVTTEYVVLELGALLSPRAARSLFIDWVETCSADDTLHIIPASSGLLSRGIELFRARPDKDWSLTDCISFVIMTERGIDSALTADHHFVQAGFKALLLD